ncbi:unnamed protein product, partial [Effrenium voratum]
AFPNLFPWGDGVPPFVKRETSMEAAEVFRYMLLREELVYGEEVTQPPLPRWSLSVPRQALEQLLPVMYDVNRRLSLMRTAKAYVKRSGFGRHCSVIASVSAEQLLMAIHGEKADIRELLRSPEVDVSLKRALGSVLQASSRDALGIFRE